MTSAHFFYPIKQLLGNDRLVSSLLQLIPIRDLSIKEFVLEEMCNGILAPLVTFFFRTMSFSVCAMKLVQLFFLDFSVCGPVQYE